MQYIFKSYLWYCCALYGTCTGDSDLEVYFNCNLVRLGVYMVKLCHKKMLILRCILLKKTESAPEKNITLHVPSEKTVPCQELYSLGIILIS